MSGNSTTPILHPYVRISHPDQRKGGGLERQTKADLQEFCRRYGFTLSNRVWVDDGVSAWEGLNATPNHELGKFIADANRGLIRSGDCLLVENYDRLSRQDPWAATSLVNDLRKLRIHIGRLDRMRLLRFDSTDPGDFLDFAMESIRGNSESNMKSMRNGDAWRRKREKAREKGSTITHRLPAWIEERDGERKAIPERAEIIAKIFDLYASGYGHAAIVKKLTADRVPAFGASGHWCRAYIALILKDRRALGEHQPRLRNGDPEGEPIKGYYPAVITESQWYAARADAAQRKQKPGRQGEHVNVFAHLVKNALDGDSYYCATRTDGGKHTRVLLNTNAAEGRGQVRSFPFATFEEAILRRLREIDPHEILNGDSGPDETTVLRGQLDKVESELVKAKADLKEKGLSETISGYIRELEPQLRELTERLAAARQRAAHPLSEAWGESKTLMDTINSAADPRDARLRLQSVLRRIIASIQMLIVPHGRDRLAAVQVWFAGGERHRDYLILHRPARANASARSEGGWWCRSMAYPSLSDSLDLRNPDDARILARFLAAMKDKDLPH